MTEMIEVLALKEGVVLDREIVKDIVDGAKRVPREARKLLGLKMPPPKIPEKEKKEQKPVEEVSNVNEEEAPADTPYDRVVIMESQKSAEKLTPFLPLFTKAISLPLTYRDKTSIMDKEVVIIQSTSDEGRAKAERTVQAIKPFSKNHKVIEIPDTEGISVDAWLDTLPEPYDDTQSLSRREKMRHGLMRRQTRSMVDCYLEYPKPLEYPSLITVPGQLVMPFS
jgi:hypothetical protein